MEFDFFSDFLKELSHYELLETFYLVREGLASDVTIFMTILFAYVTVAYFVSSKLTRFQAITISSLYSLFALFMASSAYSSSRMLSIVGYAVSGLDNSWEPVLLGIILFVAWIFSIILFVQASRMKNA